MLVNLALVHIVPSACYTVDGSSNASSVVTIVTVNSSSGAVPLGGGVELVCSASGFSPSSTPPTWVLPSGTDSYNGSRWGTRLLQWVTMGDKAVGKNDSGPPSFPHPPSPPPPPRFSRELCQWTASLPLRDFDQSMEGEYVCRAGDLFDSVELKLAGNLRKYAITEPM